VSRESKEDSNTTKTTKDRIHDSNSAKEIKNPHEPAPTSKIPNYNM
jgi:hypothetical protein